MRKGVSGSASFNSSITLPQGTEVFVHGELGNCYYVKYPKNADASDAKNFYFVEKAKVNYASGLIVWPAPNCKEFNNGWGWRLQPNATDAYGNPIVKFHSGVDVPDGRGNDVVAIADGIVINSQSYPGRGDTVVMEHNIPGIGTVYTLYQHLLEDSGTPASSKPISAGTPIGKVGSTGVGTGTHLHFEILGSYPVAGSYIDSSSSINPLETYLNNRYERCRDLRQMNRDGTAVTTKYNPNPFFKNFAYNSSFDKDFSVTAAKHSHSKTYGFLKPNTSEVWA